MNVVTTFSEGTNIMILPLLQAPVIFVRMYLLQKICCYYTLLHVAAMTLTHDPSRCTVYGQSNPLDLPNSKLTSCVAHSHIFRTFNK